MSLSCQIKNVEEWQAVLDAISALVEDAMFIVNTDGVSFRGTDPSHVALLDITFPKSSFEKFEGKTSLFGIRVGDFKAVMDSAGKNDVIDLQLDAKKLLVSISGSLNMKYKVGLLENSEVNQPIPRCSYKSKISIQPNTLSRILTNLEKISDNILINSSSGQVEFSGQGDYGDGKINIDSRDFEMNDLDSQEKITANYSLEYMIKVIRSIGKTSKMVNLEYDTQKPMHLSFDMPSATKVEYYLAPRVQ